MHILIANSSSILANISFNDHAKKYVKAIIDNPMSPAITSWRVNTPRFAGKTPTSISVKITVNEVTPMIA